MGFDKNLRDDWAHVAPTSAWFASLPPDLQSFLLQTAELTAWPAGQRLFSRGDAPDGVYCVVRGAVRITGLTATGQEAILAMLEPPQWFGEIALFDHAPRTHDAWLETDAVLARIPQDTLEQLLSERPEHWRHFGRLLTQKLRLVFINLEDIALLPATPRVARRLANMATGYGAWHDRSKRLLTVSQEQLGLMLSLSRQTVNQSLRELEAAGAIRRNRGTIEVVDLAKLREPSAPSA